MLKPTALSALISNLPILATMLPAHPEYKHRTSDRSPEQQAAAITAAEAKRLRKQAKRLADALMSQSNLL